MELSFTQKKSIRKKVKEGQVQKNSYQDSSQLDILSKGIEKR